MLNKQLQEQIEQEAIDGQVNNPTSDFKKGYNHGYGLGYEAAGEKYSELWQAAEAKIERYEKALKEIQEEVDKAKKESIFVDEFEIRLILAKALTPKTGSDE